MVGVSQFEMLLIETQRVGMLKLGLLGVWAVGYRCAAHRGLYEVLRTWTRTLEWSMIIQTEIVWVTLSKEVNVDWCSHHMTHLFDIRATTYIQISDAQQHTYKTDASMDRWQKLIWYPTISCTLPWSFATLQKFEHRVCRSSKKLSDWQRQE